MLGLQAVSVHISLHRNTENGPVFCGHPSVRRKNKQKNERMDDGVTRCVRVMNGERGPYCYEFSPYCYGSSVLTVVLAAGAAGGRVSKVLLKRQPFGCLAVSGQSGKYLVVLLQETLS